MRRLLPLITIIAVLTLQFHGLNHENTEKHQCSVCEVQANNSTNTCGPVVFIVADKIDSYRFLEFEQIVISPLIINSPARAPPIIS